METIEKGHIITFDDNIDYYVVDIIYDDQKKYVYLISDEENNKVLVGEEIIENGEVILETLEDPEKVKQIMAEVIKNFEGSS